MKIRVMRPKRLIFSGGGIRVTAFIGCLEVLEELGYLEGIVEYVGVSAGALLSFMICIGYTVKEIKEIVLGLDFSIIRNLEPDIERFGMDDGANLEKLLASLMRIKGVDPAMCFKDLVVGLRVFAADLNDCCAFEFSKRTTPDVRIVDGLRASCALPGYFMPVAGPQGHLLTDGGVAGNYPAIHLTAAELEESIGMAFNQTRVAGKIENLMQFMTQLMNTLVSHKSYVSQRTIIVPKGDYPAWNFEAGLEEKLDLVAAGREAAAAYFSGASWIQGKLVRRRHSL